MGVTISEIKGYFYLVVSDNQDKRVSLMYFPWLSIRKRRKKVNRVWVSVKDHLSENNNLVFCSLLGPLLFCFCSLPRPFFLHMHALYLLSGGSVAECFRFVFTSVFTFGCFQYTI